MLCLSGGNISLQTDDTRMAIAVLFVIEGKANRANVYPSESGWPYCDTCRCKYYVEINKNELRVSSLTGRISKATEKSKMQKKIYNMVKYFYELSLPKSMYISAYIYIWIIWGQKSKEHWLLGKMGMERGWKKARRMHTHAVCRGKKGLIIFKISLM